MSPIFVNACKKDADCKITVKGTACCTDVVLDAKSEAKPGTVFQEDENFKVMDVPCEREGVQFARKPVQFCHITHHPHALKQVAS